MKMMAKMLLVLGALLLICAKLPAQQSPTTNLISNGKLASGPAAVPALKPAQVSAEARAQAQELAKTSITPNPNFTEKDPLDSTKPKGWHARVKSEAGEISKPTMTYEKEGFLDQGSVAVHNATKQDWGEWESDPFPVEPNTLYEVVLWIRSDGAGQIEMSFAGTGGYIGSNCKDWMCVKRSVMTKPDATNATVHLVLYHRQKVTAFFDNVYVCKTGIELISPKPGSVLKDDSPVLEWRAPDGVLSASLVLSQDPTFSDDHTITVDNIATGRYELLEALAPGKWFWKIEGHLGIPRVPDVASAVASFIVQPEPGADTTPPCVTAVFPRDSASADTELRASYQDNRSGSGVDTNAVKLMLDGKDITSQARIGKDGLMAALKGLALGAHEAKMEIRDLKGNAASRTWQFRVYQGPVTVSLRDDLVLILDGKPEFPLGFYSPLPDAGLFKEIAECGFNTLQNFLLMDSGEIKIKRWLDEVHKAGLHMVAGGMYTHKLSDVEIKKRVNLYKDHPGLLGWYIQDEPDGGGIDPAACIHGKKVGAEASFHPFMTTFWVPPVWVKYVDAVDIFWCDPYPYFIFDGPEKTTLACVYELVRQARIAVKDAKPVWVVPQLFCEHPATERPPRYWEVRAMTYMGIIAGAKGIIYFAYKPSFDHVKEHPWLWMGVKALGRELTAIKDVLLSPDSGLKVSADCIEDASLVPKGEKQADYAAKEKLGVKSLVKQKGDDIWIFVVNMSPKAGKVALRAPGLAARELRVYPEDRQVAVTDGAFTDTFLKFETHIYTTAGKLPRVESVAETQKKAVEAERAWRAERVDNVAAFFNGGKATASAEPSYPSYTPTHAIDGLIQTIWSPKGGAPAWLEVAFAKPEKIDRIVVYPQQSKFFDEPLKTSLADYTLKVWDGAAWQEVGRTKDNQEPRVEHKFAPVETKKIRIDISKGSGVAEIEAWRAK